MSNRLLSRGLTERMLFPHVQDREFIHYGYGVWLTIIGHKKFKYFVMGGDPGVVMQSSYYPEWKAKAHVLANVDSGGLASLPPKSMKSFSVRRNPSEDDANMDMLRLPRPREA